MKVGDMAIHKYWKIPVLLIKQWIENAGTGISQRSRDGPEYWEVFVDGDMELVKISELEKASASR
jgi:hypothetical protein